MDTIETLDAADGPLRPMTVSTMVNRTFRASNRKRLSPTNPMRLTGAADGLLLTVARHTGGAQCSTKSGAIGTALEGGTCITR